jgi:anti-sigma B factor antagonist
MTTALQITTGQAPDGTPRLTAVGEIDLTNARQFAERLRSAIAPGGRVLVDLTRVEYLDSAALATLFAHAPQLEIHITPLNEAVLTISGLAELATVRVVPDAEPEPGGG